MESAYTYVSVATARLLHEGFEHRRDPTFAKLADIVLGHGYRNTIRCQVMTASVKRDRHDRGLRGPVLPHSAPSHESSDQLFVREMREAVEDLDARLGTMISSIKFALEEIPNKRDLTFASGHVPLGRIDQGNPTTIVLYQRPIEMRSESKELLQRVVRDVLAELVSLVTGLRPDDVDPNYEGPEIRS